MYSIHATAFGVTFPFAYALLKNKRKATYIKLFTKLKEIQVYDIRIISRHSINYFKFYHKFYNS